MTSTRGTKLRGLGAVPPEILREKDNFSSSKSGRHLDLVTDGIMNPRTNGQVVCSWKHICEEYILDHKHIIGRFCESTWVSLMFTLTCCVMLAKMKLLSSDTAILEKLHTK